MKKLTFTTLFAASLAFGATAQTVEQVSVGASYANEMQYRLSDGNAYGYAHTSWDLAFALESRSTGVWINEAAASGGTALELYTTNTTDFNVTITSNDFQDRLYNNEINASGGALNQPKDPSAPFDMGWGTYNPSNHEITGSRIFGVKMRDGSYKKLEIQSLIQGVYTLRYADLDGSNPQTLTLNQGDFAGDHFAYVSLSSNSTIDLEGTTWDLRFTRYVTPLDDGQGGILDYTVTGVLMAPGTQVAVADGIDPSTVNEQNYTNSYEDTLNTIGHDWKSFDLGAMSWAIDNDRVYFVRTNTDSIWKVRFIDFEGSSTGTTTLERTFVGVLSSTKSLEAAKGWSVYPNPATQGQVYVSLDWTGASTDAQVVIYNTLGQEVHRSQRQIHAGFQVYQLPLDIQSGYYILQIQTAEGQLSQPLQVR